MTRRNACPGYCCAAFSLPIPKSRLGEISSATHVDGDTIREMLIPLGRHRRNPVVRQSNDDRDDKVRNFYTCKFFDWESRSCLDYEGRPAMCSDFPYRMNQCPYEGCRHYNGRQRARMSTKASG